MKAACIYRYGPPEVLTIRDLPRPSPGPGDVLIRQHASTVSPADCAFRAADPFIVRMFAGWFRPKSPVLGGAVAGVVEAVGADVTRFRPGDRVFGTTDPEPGGMAEYVAGPADGALATMPEAMSFEQAGGLTYSFLTAMPFLRDEAKLKPGMRILIVGAAGSIGTVAVQLAHNMGAHVTAVCSTRNVDLVRSLGADEVIDRTRTDFAAARGAYDVIFDAVGKSSFRACGQALKPGGIYLTTVPSFAIMFQMLRGTLAEGKRAKLATTGLRPMPDKRHDMEVLQGMVARGEIKAVIDKVFPLAQIVEAHRYVELGTKAGDVIVTFP
jgi:NADPH:quinone reductase-like Zn-dependent oxidoreductase